MESSTATNPSDYHRARAELDYVYVKQLEVVMTNSNIAKSRADLVIKGDDLARPTGAKTEPLASLPQFGPKDPRDTCVTCSGQGCQGHLVYLEFPTDSNGQQVMIVNPAYAKQVRDIMSVLCHECGNILVNPSIEYEDTRLKEIRKTVPRHKRLEAVANLLKGRSSSSAAYIECTAPTRNGDTNVYCSTKHKLITTRSENKSERKTTISFEVAPARCDRATTKNGAPKKVKQKPEERTFLPRDAYDILMSIGPVQLDAIGRTYEEIEGYFMTGITLVPPRYRDSSSKSKADKITTIISNIENICRFTRNDSTELVQKLSEEVGKYMTVIDDINKAKQGHFRKFMAGKRSTYTARPVITPTKNLPFDVVVIPRRLAERGLLMPITVTESNLEECQSLFFAGEIVEIEKAAGGPNQWENIMVGTDNFSDRSIHRIAIGDKLHRKLRDGDIILHGRQPTHNIHSQLGVQVMIADTNSMEVSTNAAEEYHGDFDGDTMWTAALQTLEARNEAATIGNILRLMRNYKANVANIGVIYNGVLAGALLTRRIKLPKKDGEGEDEEGKDKDEEGEDKDKDDEGKDEDEEGKDEDEEGKDKDEEGKDKDEEDKDKKEQYGYVEVDPELVSSLKAFISAPGRPYRGGGTQAEAEAHRREQDAVYDHRPPSQRTVPVWMERFSSYYERLARHKVDPLSGAGVFSLVLPPDFNYTGGKKDGNRHVVIKDGVLVSGMLSKSTLTSNTPNSIIDRMLMYYPEGWRVAARFINEANYLFSSFLDNYGYTVSASSRAIGPPDDPYLQKAIKEACDAAELKLLCLKKPVTRIEKENYNKAIDGIVNSLTNIAKDVLTVTEDLDNWLLFMSELGSGTKGKTGNLYQMLVMLGQQKISGKRPEKGITNQQRSLPTEVPGELTLGTLGVVTRGFSSGLSPNQSMYSASDNFQGVAQNATNTPQVGKTQRYIQIAMGDVTSKKGSAVFKDKVVLQWCYGADSFDGMHIERVGQTFQAANLATILDKHS